MPMKLMKQNKGWRPLGRLFASWIFGLIPDRHRYCTYLYYSCADMQGVRVGEHQPAQRRRDRCKECGDAREDLDERHPRRRLLAGVRAGGFCAQKTLNPEGLAHYVSQCITVCVCYRLFQVRTNCSTPWHKKSGYVYTHVCVYVCLNMYLCMYVYIYIYIYI